MLSDFNLILVTFTTIIIIIIVVVIVIIVVIVIVIVIIIIIIITIIIIIIIIIVIIIIITIIIIDYWSKANKFEQIIQCWALQVTQNNQIIKLLNSTNHLLVARGNLRLYSAEGRQGLGRIDDIFSWNRTLRPIENRYSMWPRRGINGGKG